ncbi:MAG: hypothetical protein Ct9H300mP14_06880 [Gammaproteobacteria bacterium]|nr:MAG: hypothetical protein Ct9H300mP14_06880 [Gammaproteobacteria bacterium]
MRQFLRENPDIAQAIEHTVRTNVGLAPIDEMTLKPAVPIDTADVPEAEMPKPDAATGPDPVIRARDTAFRLLTRREHSRAKPHKKLTARGYDSDIVDNLLASLAAEDLVSAHRYAQAFVSSCEYRLWSASDHDGTQR